MDKFDNISDELLAAFIDGNTTTDEIVEIRTFLEQDDFLSEIFDVAIDVLSFENNIDNWNGDYQFDNIESSISNSCNDATTENISLFPNNIGDRTCMDNISQINSHIMNKATYNVYGESGENIKDPIFIQQPDDHSCALRSQQLVLRDFGIDIPFENLEQIALDAGVYTEEGTYTSDIGKVLQIAGVGMHQVEGSTIFDLTNELSQGHRIIVSVDSNELWYSKGIVNKTTNWLSDVFGNQGGNHALIVAGIEVNPDNPDDIKVVLTDPGAGDLRIEYPIDQFMDAWEDSNCFMAATDNPAPYQYDIRTGMEVPSNFATQQFYNAFVSSHSYQLNPDLVNIPSDYQPYYNGYIEMIGDTSYDDFHEKYEELQCARQEGSYDSHGIVGDSIVALVNDIKGMFDFNKVYDDSDIKIYYGKEELPEDSFNVSDGYDGVDSVDDCDGITLEY